MSSVRVGFGALVAAASLYALTGQAAAGEPAGQESGHASHMTKSSKSSSSTSGERTASGNVKSIDSKALTLNNGEQVRLTHDTKFLRDGQTASLQDVKPGEQVRASYEPRGKVAYADRIEILSNKHTKK